MLIAEKYSVQTDETDWPIGISEQDKETIMLSVFDSLHGAEGLRLNTIYMRTMDRLTHKHGWSWQKKKDVFGIGWGRIYGIIERALRGIEAKEVWTLRNVP